MGSEIIIREAQKKDAKEIVSLLKQVIDYHCEFDKNYKPFSDYKNMRKNIMSRMVRRDTKIFVAESGGKIIGYCEGVIEKAPGSTIFKKMGSIDTLIVTKKHRKKGAGEKLASALMKWFREKKIKYAELNVDSLNVLGIRFWNSCGFSGYRVKMRKNLK